MNQHSHINNEALKTLDFFFEGDDYYAALQQAFRQAQKTIEIEIYNWASDSLGMEFADLLCKKSREGVLIRVIYDAFGSFNTSKDLFKKLTDSKIELREFNPLYHPAFKLKERNHRKYFIIDEQMGFLGGFNITEEFSQRLNGMDYWSDCGVCIQLPYLIQSLSNLFKETWDITQQPKPNKVDARTTFDSSQDTKLKIIASRGWENENPCRADLIQAFQAAKSHISLTSPYFVPDKGFLKTLMVASVNGVEIKILISRENDSKAALAASQALYQTLLKSGVRIFEFKQRMVHAKLAVVDNNWFTIGTSNLDHLSFYNNLEINLSGKSPAEAMLINQHLEELINSAEEIILERWLKRGILQKIKERFFFLFRRSL